MKKVLSSVLVLLAVLAFWTTVQAQPKVVLKIASIAPEKTPWVNSLEKWKNNTHEASKGEIEIKLFHSGQLGNEFDVLKQVRRGRISGAGFSAAPFSESFPELALMATPYLFEDIKIHDCIYDTVLNKEFDALLEKKDLKVLQWLDAGTVHVYAKDDLSDPTSARGYKVRVALHPISRLLWTSLSANGVELPYIETPPALQTGMVRGGESAALSYFGYGLNKVAPHLMLTGHYYQAGAIVLSLKVWNKLSPDHQKALVDALPGANESRTAVRGASKFLIENYKEAGGPVHELTPEQRAAWKAKVEPNWPKFVKDLGPEAEAMWPKVLEAIKTCQ